MVVESLMLQDTLSTWANHECILINGVKLQEDTKEVHAWKRQGQYVTSIPAELFWMEKSRSNANSMNQCRQSKHKRPA